MSTVAIDRTRGSTATTELLVLEPVAQRLGLAPVLLVPGEITFGSGADCQVRLVFPGVQERHCVLTCTRSRISARAVDRRTWHNNLPLTDGWLRLGDRLAVGPVEYRVRQAEPWDILPAPEPLPVAQPILTNIGRDDASGQIELVEARLTRQIADLEAEIARHQATVARLEQPIAQAAVAAPELIVNVPTVFPEVIVAPSAPPKSVFVSPVFHLSRVSPATGIDIESVGRVSRPVSIRSDVPEDRSYATHDTVVASTSTSTDAAREEEHARLLAELEAQHIAAGRKLDELSAREAEFNVREYGFDRQCHELAAQWDQLRRVMAEVDADTLQHCQRDRELTEREQRCTSHELELVQREAALRQILDQAIFRDIQQQSAEARIADQLLLLETREKALDLNATQLSAGQVELEQLRYELEQQQGELARQVTAYRVKLDVLKSHAVALAIDRQTAESEWTRRAEVHDAKTCQQQSWAEDLVRLQKVSEVTAARTREEQERLAAEQTRLEVWSNELAQQQTALAERESDLKAQVADHQSQSDDLERLQESWKEAHVQSQHENERLASELTRLEAWNGELAHRQATLNEQGQELDGLASALRVRELDLAQRTQAWEEASTQTQRELTQLDEERLRLETWNGDLAQQQALLIVQRQQLDADTSALNLRADELTQRSQACEEAAFQTRQEQLQLSAERLRLETWCGELAQQQASLIEERQQLEIQAAAQTVQGEELQQQMQAWELKFAETQQEQAQLAAERSRLESWTDELLQRQTALNEQQREFNSQAVAQRLQGDELQQRQQSWEATVAATQLEREHLTAEQSRLQVWSDELDQRQATLTQQQRALEAGRSEWNELQRASAESTAAALSALAAEKAELEQVRQEQFLAECELEELEADLDEFEIHLQSRDSEFAAREELLHQAECELAWHLRAAELSGADSASTRAGVDWLVDQNADKIAKQIGSLTAERDELAIELFTQTLFLEDHTDQTDIHSQQLRRQAEQVQRDLETWRKQSAELNSDRERLAADRLELQQQHADWHAEQQRLQAVWETRQSWLAVETERVQSQADLLQSREAEFQAKWEALNSERRAFDQNSEQIQLQQAELVRQREALEQQQQQLSIRTTELLVTAASQADERTAWENESEAARTALRDREEDLGRSQAELDRLRQALDLEREEWELQLKFSPALAAPELRTTHILDEISRLEHLMQDELQHDSRTDDDTFAHAANDVSRDDFTDNDLSDVPDRDSFAATPTPDEETSSEFIYGSIDPVEPVDYGTARSLWADDSLETNPRPDLDEIVPATDEDPSVLSLRARLAEMFHLDEPAAHQDPVESDEQIAEPTDEYDHPEYFAPEEDEAASLDQDLVAAELPRSSPVVAPAPVEPEADEYDSVESYMQRLLDRNRKSRAGEEPEAERVVPASKQAPAPVSVIAPPAPTLSESDAVDSESEPEAEPEVVRTPMTPREPVDMQKVRAGLVNLRQVANVSARSAIARSKWNKIRAKIAGQCLLTGVCWTIGIGILTGKLPGLAAMNLWGWVSVVMGTAVGAKILWDIRSIFHGDSGHRKVSESADTH